MNYKQNHFHGMIETQEIMRRNNRKYTIRGELMRYFFPDEWMCFYDKLKGRQKITFNTLINTGARINEIRNIRVSDIDKDRESIILRVTKSRTKSGERKVRVIKVSSQFIKYITKVIKEREMQYEDYLPILSTPAANIAMKKALKEIGLPDYKMLSVHSVRKTLETWLLSLNIDGMKIIRHFGHSFAIAGKHYVSPDVFNFEDKRMMRMVIGDLYER